MSNTSTFLSLLFRQKYIRRWGLMRSLFPESLSDHSFETAAVTHMLAMIGNAQYDRGYDADYAAMTALYHDAGEVYTGDLPTPIKYHSTELRDSYKQLEEAATEKLLTKLPEDLRDAYRKYLMPADERYIKLVKAADKLCALLKCMEEERNGSKEFANAIVSIRASVDRIAEEMPEVRDFMSEMLGAFEMTIDEL